jgi:hypothetical protein
MCGSTILAQACFACPKAECKAPALDVGQALTAFPVMLLNKQPYSARFA